MHVLSDHLHSFTLGLELLHELWRNGGIVNTLGIGHAHMQKYVHMDALAKCEQMVEVNLFSHTPVRVLGDTTRNCEYAYRLHSSVPIPMDRKYMHDPFSTSRVIRSVVSRMSEAQSATRSLMRAVSQEPNLLSVVQSQSIDMQMSQASRRESNKLDLFLALC
jgi:hypothetical protein